MSEWNLSRVGRDWGRSSYHERLERKPVCTEHKESDRRRSTSVPMGYYSIMYH